MCLAVMKCAIELGNFTHVNAYITKAEHSPDSSKDTVTQSKLKAASGLAALDAKKYRLAGKKLTEVRNSAGSSLHHFTCMSPSTCRRCYTVTSYQHAPCGFSLP